MDYDIQNYTDEQLFRILDLDNPSDRELEAKILHLIWKYSNFHNESGQKLMDFFQNMYDHFFDEEGEDMIEGMENSGQGQGQGQVPGNDPNSNAITTTDSSSRNFSYAIPVDYSKDKLNPLLKQTTKRIVSIDSQFRENTNNTTPTNFTFNLSTPLKDVVSLKLYSYAIPYTWYTISNSYGSNFFYLRGNTPGIDDGTYNFQIKIGVGNYTVQQIIDTINTEFTTIKNDKRYADISFGTTAITYNQNSALATLNLNLQKFYNETYYEMYFSGWTTPAVSSNVFRT